MITRLYGGNDYKHVCVFVCVFVCVLMQAEAVLQHQKRHSQV
jgi:hypothetical protein